MHLRDQPVFDRVLIRYAFAVVVVLVALLAKFALDPILQGTSPFLIFSAAIVLSAWLGGAGPGLFATALAALLTDYFFLDTRGQFISESSADRLRLILFIAEGILVSGLSGAFHAARARTEQARHTERIRALETSTIVDAMGEAVILFKPNGALALSNTAADDLFSGPAGISFSEFNARFVDANGMLPRLHTRIPEGPIEARLDGTDRWFELRGYPAAESTLIMARETTTDRRTAAIRDSFIGIMSHELRTPITTIFGGAKVLARPDVSEATRRELSLDIEAEADRLYRLVEDLLVLSKAERNAVDAVSDPVQVQHLVRSVVAAETARLPDRRIDVTVGPDIPTGSGDATYVEQVLRNLIGNAIKYSPSDSPIEIGVEGAGSMVRIRVRDHGPGVDPTEASHLFDLFFRSKAVAALPGAGVGLFVCRQLALAMGGDVTYEGLADGSAFTLSVPAFATDEIPDE